MTTDIPFNKPYVAGNELAYVAEAIELGNISGDGLFTRRCQQLLEQRFGIGRVLLMPSCTAALETAAMLFDIGPGDEVILPSYTFVSTANAFVRLGARPVFVEIRADTLNIDAATIEAAITPRTRAICAVHYAGVACEMEAILAIAERYGLRVVEDAAQGVHAYYHGRALGSLAPLGCYSFHATKNYTCGEGGALCINDRALIERAEILREKGTDRSKFSRGEVDKYTWVDVGSSYVPSEISSAFLFGQLERLEPIAERRRAIFERYRTELQPLADHGLLRLPFIPPGCVINYHMFHVLVADQPTRDALVDHLRRRSISAPFHYVPLHTSPMGERLGYVPGDLPLTEALAGRTLRLPFFYAITEEQQRTVVREIGGFLGADS